MARKAVNKGKQKNIKRYKVNYMRIFLIIFFIYFAFSFFKQQFEINEYNIQIGHIENQIREAAEETEDLIKSKGKINDAEYIEDVAREQLGLVKPYEKIFIDVNK